MIFIAPVQLRLRHLQSQLPSPLGVQLLVRSVAQLALSLAGIRKTCSRFKVRASFVRHPVILRITGSLPASAGSSSSRLITGFGTRGTEGRRLLRTTPVISIITPRPSVSEPIQRVAAGAASILILLCLFVIVFSTEAVRRSSSSNSFSRDLTILTNFQSGIVDQ